MKDIKSITKVAMSIAAIFMVSNTVLAADNVALMQCSFKNGKTVQLINQAGNLIYVYGKNGATAEAMIPKGPNGNASVKHNSISAGSNSMGYYRFINGDYSYVVLDREGDAEGWNGTALGVFKGTKLVQVSKCVNGSYKAADGFDWAANTFTGVAEESGDYDTSMMEKLSK
jgi:hypothetical protein